MKAKNKPSSTADSVYSTLHPNEEPAYFQMYMVFTSVNSFLHICAIQSKIETQWRVKKKKKKNIFKKSSNQQTTHTDDQMLEVSDRTLKQLWLIYEKT